MGLLLAGLALLALALRRQWRESATSELAVKSARDRVVGLLACAYAIAIGAAERLGRRPLDGGSDVLPATEEAIGVLLAGGNPYTHVLLSTNPVGSPFVYPPGEILFYIPAYLAGFDLHRVETWTGIFTIFAIAAAGARAGWGVAALPAMLYATWGIAAFRTTDGGNDVSAAFLVVVAFTTLAFPGRLPFIASAFVLGWAVAFKQFAVLVLPLALRHLAVAGLDWRRYALVSLGTATVMTLPFFLMDPVAFASQQLQALTFHEEVWGANLLNTLASSGADVSGLVPLFFVLELALTLVALALVLRSRLDTLGRTLIVACLLVAIPLLLARWTTQSYFVYAVTLALAGVALGGQAAGGYQAGRRSPDHARSVEPGSS